ncbi:MAG TPA: RluA family pseudouridine synthase [Kofleriaceae bacterium]|nr:RluA family pseudouridine synthase [Kofleriaceae bacterium]
MAGARKLTASGRDRGRPLAEFLAERLGLERAAAATLVRAGAVYVGRSRVEEPERALDAGDRVAVHEAEAMEEAALSIAYRDRDVLVVDKPAGVPTQATRSSARGALDRMVSEMEAGARLLHRLDRDASGLVLFTLTQESHRRFAALLRDGRIERRYAAVASGHLRDDAGCIDRPIGPDPRDRRRMAAGQGRPARTHYTVRRRGFDSGGAPTTLLDLDLETGRTHQIRVHLASAGHPLIGDRIYGPAPVSERLCLHARRLAWPDAAPVVSPEPGSFEALTR